MNGTLGIALGLARRIKGLGLGLGGLAIPRVCAACGEALGEGPSELCLSCWDELQRAIGGTYCKSCGEDRQDYLLRDGRCTACVNKTARPRYDQFVRVGRYDGALKRLILRFKHHFVLDRLLGRLLADAILGQLDPGEVDVWVPVPAHWRRRISSGFQPTDLLARAVAGRLGGQLEPVLIATRFVEPFHLRERMSARERSEAIRGVFRVARGVDLAECTVCVIDDVTTTGATLSEARRALFEGGAEKVLVAVLAKAAFSPAPLPQAVAATVR